MQFMDPLNRIERSQAKSTCCIWVTPDWSMAIVRKMLELSASFALFPSYQLSVGLSPIVAPQTILTSSLHHFITGATFTPSYRK